MIRPDGGKPWYGRTMAPPALPTPDVKHVTAADGTRIVYRDYPGELPGAVLMSNGIGCDEGFFHPLIRALRTPIFSRSTMFPSEIYSRRITSPMRM